MHGFLLSLLQHHVIIGYAVIFFGIMFEGDGLIFTAAFLTHRGFFEPALMFPILLIGTIIGDLFWYALGVKLDDSGNWINQWLKKLAAPFDEHIIKSPLHTIMISKFTYGLHHPILIRAGALKLNLHEYIKDDLISSVVWILIVGGLGFGSSASFYLVQRYIKFVELYLLLGVAAFFIIWHLIALKAKKKL
ncbi:MAG TPA: VTT domain-containing protein [Patescibacteria group bacterium]|jgi:membrane protein DedA with SNARE-associated domain|nr:VTT domain-containing protein [Patescibacteria group bacterium]